MDKHPSNMIYVYHLSPNSSIGNERYNFIVNTDKFRPVEYPRNEARLFMILTPTHLDNIMIFMQTYKLM